MDLREFAARLEGVSGEQPEAFMKSTVNELAARLLALVIPATPVGRYPKSSGKKGGTLRRGWTAKAAEKTADGYTATVINPTEYASYVEFGHRTRNHTGWVPGQFFLKRAEQKLNAKADQIIGKQVDRFLREVLK